MHYTIPLAPCDRDQLSTVNLYYGTIGVDLGDYRVLVTEAGHAHMAHTSQPGDDRYCIAEGDTLDIDGVLYTVTYPNPWLLTPELVAA